MTSEMMKDNGICNPNINKTSQKRLWFFLLENSKCCFFNPGYKRLLKSFCLFSGHWFKAYDPNGLCVWVCWCCGTIKSLFEMILSFVSNLYQVQGIDFLGFTGLITQSGCWKNKEVVGKLLTFGLWLTNPTNVLPIPQVKVYASKLIESAVNI